MKLSEFNLTTKIREYNKKYQKNINESSSFGCQSLRDGRLGNMQGALLWVHIGDFKEEYNEKRFSNPALSFLESRQKLNIIPKQNKSEDFIAARNFYFWKKRWKEKFNDDNFWKNLIENSKFSRNRLIDFQKKWSDYAEYSTYTQNELVYIIKTIIPEISKYIQFAELEISKKKHNIPEPIYIELMEYFTNVKKDLQLSQSRISQTMLQQLLLSFEDKNHQFDIISHYLRVMKIQGNQLIDLPNYLPAQLSFDMESLPDYLDGILSNISIENLETLQNKLKKINCQIFKTAFGYQVIPQELKKYIPSKIPFYRIFGIGDAFRAEFFRFKSKFLLSMYDAPSLRQLNIATSTPSKIDFEVNKIINLSEVCQNEILEIKNCRYRGIFFRKTQKFLNDWKSLVDKNYTDYVDQKIQFAERLIVSIRGSQRNQDSPQDNVMSSILEWNKVATLKTIIDSLSKDSLDKERFEKYTILKNGWSKFQNSMLAFQIIKEIENGGNNFENLLKLTTLLSVIRVNSADASGVFISSFRDKFNNLTNDYLSFIKHHPFDYKNLNDAEEDLKRNYQTMLLIFEITKIPDDSIRKQFKRGVDRKFYKYVISYYEGLIWFSKLNSSGEIPIDAKNRLNKYFLSLESHILKMAELLEIHHLYRKHPISDLLGEIVERRKNEDWMNLICDGKKALFFIMKDQKFAEKRFEKDYAVFSERLSSVVEEKSLSNSSKTDPGSFRKILKKLHKINFDFKKPKYKNAFDNVDEIMPLLEACQKAKQTKEKITGTNDQGAILAQALEKTLRESSFIEDSEAILLKDKANNSLSPTKFFDKKYVNTDYQSPLSFNI